VSRRPDIYDDIPDETADAPEAPEGRRFRWRPFAWVSGPSRAIALSALVLLVVLFGRDVLSSWHLRGEIETLRERRQELLDSLAADSLLLRRLDDPRFLERYARERYLMRRAGETVSSLIRRYPDF
jgi:cell division protein FtsB